MRSLPRFLSLAATGALAVSLVTAAPAGAIELADGYTPSKEGKTCLIDSLCGDKWGLGFEVKLMALQLEYQNSDNKPGISAGSIADAATALGSADNKQLMDSLNALKFGESVKDFFSTPEQVQQAFAEQMTAYAEKQGQSESAIADARSQFVVWGNFVEGAKKLGVSADNAKKFGELRPLFLDRIKYAGIKQATKELFEALAQYNAGKEPSFGPLAVGSALPGGPLGSTNGFHPADNLGGLAGGSSGLGAFGSM